MAGQGGAQIDKFDGSDFGYWKMQVEDYLYQKSLYQPLTGAKPEAMSAADWAVLDRKALGFIRLTLAKNVAFNVKNVTSTVDIMKVLADTYEKPSASNKVHLMRRLFNLKMVDGTRVADHVNEFNGIISQLSSVEINLEDEVLALILLSSLPESWSATVTAVSSSSGTKKMKLADIRGLILTEDIRRKDLEGPSSSALITEGRGRTQERSQGGDRGKSRGKSKTKAKGTKCWHCGKTGHWKKECRSWKGGDGNKTDQSANAAAEVQDALVTSEDVANECWYLDSAASYHYTPHQEWISDFTAKDLGKVYLVDDGLLHYRGAGEMHIQTASNVKFKLTGVRYVPGLKRNLISVGQLDDAGYAVLFKDCAWKITKGAMVIMKGLKCGTLYKTTLSKDCIALVGSENDTMTWHRRLGHMSEKGMKMMLERGMLHGLTSLEMGQCEDCILGKQTRVSFSKTARTPKKEKLELVHSDVWGPAPVPSLGGSRYYVTFIDDSTRKVWVYFMKNKSDVFMAFKKWKSQVELESSCKVKCLRSDNGGEYVRYEFKNFGSEHGIRMERTVPRTPRQNGVAERMNRTLNERARSMRLHAGLSKSFWADAINTAAHLINRGPSVPLDYRLPEECWTGRKVDLSYLKNFGCLCYVLLDSDSRDKLDAKSKKCYFIGYGDEEFGYRLWDDADQKVLRSQNVVFNETIVYKDKDSAKLEQETGMKPIELEEIHDEDPPNDVDGHPEVVSDEAEVTTPIPEIRRSTRARRPTARYSPDLNYILMTDGGEPESYAEAKHMEDSVKWELEMQEEMDSLHKNHTWELTPLPNGKKALHNKWVYRIKQEHDGSKRYKARLVVKGFQQREGVDYTEIFSPVVKLTTVRLVLSIVAAEDLHLEQLDVKTAFLHGELEEDIYMVQPEGFLSSGGEDLVCKLKRSLYGLKQAPRQWYKRFDAFMIANGFSRSEMDHCCYLKKFKGSYIILLLYVDDMLIAGANMKEILYLKESLAKEFAMKDLGAAKQIRGMRIVRERRAGVLTLSQEQYIEKVLCRFNMQNAKPVKTPLAAHFKLSSEHSPKTEEERNDMKSVPYASAIGSLMYAMVGTRPDIAHAVGVVSRFMANPGREHWEAVHWILRYLRGTSGMSLCFGRGDPNLQGYVDSDLGGDVDTRRSTTGYVYTFGGTAVSWVSQLQKLVALSTTEAEYVAITEASKEMLWLNNFLVELG